MLEGWFSATQPKNQKFIIQSPTQKTNLIHLLPPRISSSIIPYPKKYLPTKMSALSMAASTVAAAGASSSSSSSLHTRLSNLSFTHSPLPTIFLFKPFKPLKLNTQILNSLSPFSLPRLHRTFSAFDSFDVSQDEAIDAEDDPQEEFEQEEEKEELKPAESSEEAKLYVGNLPYSMTASDLEEIFVEAGRVVNVEIIYDRVTDRSRGFGFATMASVEEAQEAIRMFNGSQIGGRTIRVNFPEVPKGGEREVVRNMYKGFVDSPYKIYAGNLGWGITSQGLRDAFANEQGLLSAKVIYERDTGRSRGFGFVSFESAEYAEAALNAMNGVEVEGRPLRLNLAADRTRTPPAQEENTQNNIESTELLSSISS